MNTTKTVLIILALAGALIMGYLLNLHLVSSGQSFCDLGSGLSCSEVNSSEYAKVLGIPVSLLGLVYFLGVLYVLVARYSKENLGRIAFVTTVFLGPSLYLSYLEFFVIKSICLFCELSKIVMLAVIFVALYGMRPKKPSGQKIVVALVLAVIAALGTYVVQQDRGVPSGTYDTFAQCITDSGMVMYGSQGCSSCGKQRALFGDSFQYINEIECDPRFEDHDPQVQLCISKNIEGTPTWILEDESGNTLTKYGKGVLTLEELSEASGCPLIKDEVANTEKQ